MMPSTKRCISSQKSALILHWRQLTSFRRTPIMEFQKLFRQGLRKSSHLPNTWCLRCKASGPKFSSLWMQSLPTLEYWLLGTGCWILHDPGEHVDVGRHRTHYWSHRWNQSPQDPTWFFRLCEFRWRCCWLMLKAELRRYNRIATSGSTPSKGAQFSMSHQGFSTDIPSIWITYGTIGINTSGPCYIGLQLTSHSKITPKIRPFPTLPIL